MPRMPSRPTSSIPEGWDQPALKKSVVEILDILELLFRHLTPTLCETVFDEARPEGCGNWRSLWSSSYST